MNFVDWAVFGALGAQTVRMAIPYMAAALGGIWSERSGVINIALEGMILVGAFVSVTVHLATSSAVLGLIAGSLAAAAMGLAHALVCVIGRVDAIVSGIALNLVAAGGTRFILRALYQSSSNSPPVEGFRIAAFQGASVVNLIERTVLDPCTLLIVALAPLTAWVFLHTRFGLRVRASGEAPNAAASIGVPVNRIRIFAVTIGGAIAGVGGVALAYDQHQFQAGMSAGRGFMALAAVIVAGWRPMPAMLACVVFAFLEGLQIVLQDKQLVSPNLVQMVPYAVTLATLLLIGIRRRRAASSNVSTTGGPPAGLGVNVT